MRLVKMRLYFRPFIESYQNETNCIVLGNIDYLNLFVRLLMD